MTTLKPRPDPLLVRIYVHMQCPRAKPGDSPHLVRCICRTSIYLLEPREHLASKHILGGTYGLDMSNQLVLVNHLFDFSWDWKRELTAPTQTTLLWRGACSRHMQSAMPRYFISGGSVSTTSSGLRSGSSSFAS